MKTLKNTLRVPLVSCLMLSALAAHSQTDTVYAWANFVGQPGGQGNADGPGSAARFRWPRGAAVDSAGNLFVADTYNNTIRKVTAAGVVTTLAGSAVEGGSADGTGSAARFYFPEGVAVDSAGNVFVADTGNYTIRKVTPAGEVTTLAGSAGNPGSADGTGGAARFRGPVAVAVDSGGNLFVADASNHTIRKVTPAGEVTTLAGNALSSGSADGTGSAARFYYPDGVAVDSGGNLFVADRDNHTIRKVTPAGEVTTLAGNAENPGSADGTGSAARFSAPYGVAVDGASNVFVGDSQNHTIRKVTPAGVVTTLAGNAGNPGSADGVGSAARFEGPSGVAVDSAGNLFVTDSQNHTIRKVTPAGVVTTLAGSAMFYGSADGPGSAARFWFPNGVAVDSAGNLFVTDSHNHTIRKVTEAGEVTTLAGSAGSSGSADGPGSAARFYFPEGVAVDTNGNVFVADSGSTIRKVTPAGEVTTLAGLAYYPGSADGTGSAARFSGPSGVAVDPNGNVFVADAGNHTIRKVTAAVEVTTLAGSAGSSGSADGPGSAARFRGPSGVAVDTNGNVFVADAGNHTIRKVTAGGEVTTLAGSALSSGSADGPGSAARFYYPRGIAVDSAGNLFVGDTDNRTIRKVTAAGEVTTLGGLAGVWGGADGIGSSANFARPTGIAVDSAGTLYVADFDNNRITKGTPLFFFDTSPAALQWTPNGLQLTVTGLLGRGTVTIYVSTNLVTWDVLLTNPPVTGTFQVLDGAATNAATRFYRASEQR